MLEYEPFIDTMNYNTPYAYFKYVFMFPIVLLRMSLLGCTVCGFYCFSFINKEKYKKTVDTLLIIISKIILFIFGFYNVKVKNTNYIKDALDKKAIIIFNHVTIIDTFFIWAKICLTSPLMHIKWYMYFYRLSKFVDAIPVDVDNKNASNSNKIFEFTDNNFKTNKLIAIAPEGVITNGYSLIQFRTGAFITDKPVLPIILKFPNKYINVSWSQNYSTFFVVYNMFSQLYNNAVIEVLPLQYKNPDETAREFADRVRDVMSEASGLSKSNVYGYDVNNAMELYYIINKANKMSKTSKANISNKNKAKYFYSKDD